VTDREFLQERLRTLQSLTGGAARLSGGSSGLQSTLQANWLAEQRLLTRILAEPGDVRTTLARWQERTQAFVDQNPERAGWTDAQGHSWQAAQVLTQLHDLSGRLETLNQPIEFADDEEDDDE
jgi:hypothetical protein